MVQPWETVTENLKNDTVKIKRHCVKSVQVRSYFWSIFNPNTGKYEPEIAPHLDTFHEVRVSKLKLMKV